MQSSQNGFLIAIEGIDGAGKSTLARLLSQRLQDSGYETVVTKEPGGTATGKEIRAIVQNTHHLDPKTEFLLFAADRAQHIKEVVKPALDLGKIVISDRMADSSLAYQGFGRQGNVAMIELVNRWVMDEVAPNSVIYLRIDPQTAFLRIRARNEKMSQFEQEKISFFERVVAGFEEIFKNRTNIIYIDALQPVEEIVQQVLEQTLHYFKDEHKK